MDKLITFTELQDKEKELLFQIMQHKAITRKKLSEILGLKNATLYRMIDSFILIGLLIANKDMEATTVGRPSDIIQLNSQYGYFFSICIRRFSYQTALIDLNFNIILNDEFNCDETTPADSIRENCFTSYCKMLQKANIKRDRIIGIVVTSFNSAKDHYTKEHHHPGFSWLAVNDIREFFRERFNHNVFFGNVALSAACSRYYSSYFPQYKNLAYIILDEGIGIGYIIDKKIPRLSMRNVSALGHMIVDMHGPKCHCGQYGCLEALVNDFAIVHKTQNELKIRQQGLLVDHINELNILQICKAAEKIDIIACQTLEYAASVLSIGIENFLKIFQLEVIIVSGKMVNGSSFFFNALKERLQSRHPSLIVKTDDQEWANSLKGTAEWYMNELLSLTPLPELIE